MSYRPPYELTAEIFNQLKSIIRLIGQIEGYQLLQNNLQLRRENKIRSLHSSLAIEGNTLTEAQMTDIIEGKRVLGPTKDILEVKNAIKVYDQLEEIDPFAESELLRMHETLMHGLIDDAGQYRQKAVGVLDGEKVVHIAPPAKRVPALMGDLFEHLNEYQEDTIIKSCVFHYEFEFIHPFSDGNGRMGRLWQTAILKTEYPDLVVIPLENMVYARQEEYYRALQDSQSVGNSTPFILYALSALEDTLKQQLDQATNLKSDPESRLRSFRASQKGAFFSRKEYLSIHKQISPATATRDLSFGLERGLLIRKGQYATTRYQFLV